MPANVQLKLKQDYKKTCITSEFWYDLFLGGYIKPKDFLTTEDANRVVDAMAVIDAFETLLEDEGIMEYS